MFISTGKTDIGIKRNVNQDYFKIGNIYNACWAIVCDGLGGEKAGDVASKTATEIIYNHIQECFKPEMTEKEIKNMLTMAFNLANSKIFDMGEQNSNYKGMATTAIISFINNNILHISHVGDSRIYLIDNQTVTQLTKDDSLVQALIEKGTLSKDEAKKHPKRNCLTKAIGVEKNVDIYYDSFKISQSNKILMCTDGLYNYMDDDTIRNMFYSKPISNLVEGFIKLALSSGGSDNITAVIMFDTDYNDESRVNDNG